MKKIAVVCLLSLVLFACGEYEREKNFGDAVTGEVWEVKYASGVYLLKEMKDDHPGIRTAKKEYFDRFYANLIFELKKGEKVKVLGWYAIPKPGWDPELWKKVSVVRDGKEYIGFISTDKYEIGLKLVK